MASSAATATSSAWAANPLSRLTARLPGRVRAVWAGWTLLLAIGSVVTLANGSPAGLLGLVLAGLAGWYDYRMWTGRAKWLNILIIF